MMKERMDNTDPEQVALNKKRSQILQEQKKADVQSLLATPYGKRFLWRILEETHIFQTSMTGNSHTFFLEGERQVGTKVWTWLIDADQDFYPKLLKEKQIGELTDV